MSDYKDLVSSKKLPSGAKVLFFADGKYKLFPSKSYNDRKQKFKAKITIDKAEPSKTITNCNKLIEDIFKYKNRGL